MSSEKTINSIDKLNIDRINLFEINSGEALEKIRGDERTEIVCLHAVRKDGLNLRYVENQTDEICLEAVKNRILALHFVKNQTKEICLAAVNANGTALNFVETQTEEICLAAVRQSGLALNFVENQTEEICLAAVNQNGLALCYVESQTDEICLAAVEENGLILEYVENQTEEICLAAVKQNGFAIVFAKDITREMCLLALNNSINTINLIDFEKFDINYKDVDLAYINSEKNMPAVSTEDDLNYFYNIDFANKLYDKICNLNDENLIKLVDNDLKNIFKNKYISKNEKIINLKEKVAMLKMSAKHLNNNNKKNKFL